MNKRLSQNDKAKLFFQINKMIQDGTIRTKDIARMINRTEADKTLSGRDGRF